MTTATTKKATVTGDTFTVKGQLKSGGWQWNPEVKGWTKDVPSEYDERMTELSIRSLAGIRNRMGKITITFE